MFTTRQLTQKAKVSGDERPAATPSIAFAPNFPLQRMKVTLILSDNLKQCRKNFSFVDFHRDTMSQYVLFREINAWEKKKMTVVPFIHGQGRERMRIHNPNF